MANSTQRRNVVWTMAIAAVTVIAGLAVVAGPPAMQCLSSPDGLGACLRDRIADTGLLPPREPAPVVEAETAVPPAAEPEKAPQVAGSDLPTGPGITLVRAEPDGSVIVAGTAAPGTAVTVYANGEPFGTVTAEASGDWALVPELPLGVGGTELSVGIEGQAEIAERAFVVVVDPDRTTEARVLESTAGQAAAVLGDVALAAPAGAAAAPGEVEAVAPPAEATPAPEAATRPETEPTDVAVATEAPAPVPDMAREAGTSENAAPAPESGVAVAETPVETAAPAADAAAPVADTETELAEAEGPAAEPDAIEVADVPEAAVTPPAEVALVPPTIDAIEIDGGKNFFAGTGEDGATVRVFVDGKLAGESRVADGYWLVEAERSLLKPTQRVRAELSRGGSERIAAAEVNFGVDLPVAAPAEVAPDLPQASERARAEVALALGGIVTLAAPAPGGAAEPALLMPADERARTDVQAALENEIVRAAPVAELPVEPATEPSVAADERARGDVAAALAGVVTQDVPVRPAAQPSAEPAIASVSADERARSEVEVALGNEVVLAAPALEPAVAAAVAPVLPSVAPADRARLDVGTALETQVMVPANEAAEAVAEPVGPTSADRGRADAELALLSPRELAAPIEAEDVAGKRAAQDVAEALTRPRELPASAAPALEPPAVAAVPAESRARADVATALGSVIEISPPATSPIVEVPAPASETPAPVAPAVADAAAASGAPVEQPPHVAVVPEAGPTAPDRAGDRAADEVATALVPDAIRPVVPAAPVAPLPAEVVPAPVEPVPAPEPEPQPPAAEAAPLPEVAEATPAPAAPEPAPQVAEAPPEPAVVEAPEAPPVPTIRAEPVGASDEGRFSSGRVIIRRGDTLWDIAERVYGAGWKYPTIYRANRHKIVRPGRIFPGQVFELPAAPARLN